jgi:peptide chain release factor 1
VQLFSKLDQVVQRFQELSAQLQDPKVYADQARLHKIAKERKDLEEIVATYQEYLKVEREIADNTDLQKGSDRELASLATEELPGLQARLIDLEGSLKAQLMPKDPLDEKNILLEIRGGTGGEEAALFAADLFRMYSHYAERHNWKVEVMSQSEASAGGLKEIIVLFSGERVYSHLKFEGGVHRVQRVPVTEAQGRIHTSTVTVAVMPEADEVDVALEEKDLDISVCRAGGPGGQGVNTTDSAVIIVHKPTGLTVRCQDERSQQKNKSKAKKILLARLLEIKIREQEEQLTENRRRMVGSGERAEKIRTYNFPQNRISDHRIGLTLHKLDRIMDGDLDELLDALKTHYQAEALKGTNS